MTSQPDKLFRDKLQNLQRPAPAGAWDKIELNLSHTHKKIIWIRVAAGIVLISAAAIALWPAGEEKRTIAVKHDPVPVIKDIPNKKTVPVQQEQRVSKSALVKTEQAQTKKQNPVTLPAPEQRQVVQNPVILPTAKQELVADIDVPEQQESTSTTLVYTAAEVNAKFLKKKLPPEATPKSEDASHIQKLIGLAYAAKNSDTGLGDLRQKKDDLLALSFGKKKGEN